VRRTATRAKRRKPHGHIDQPRKQTQWPSLEEQLSALGIRYGSALEQFVKDNQDFSLLGPKEANDDLGFPLWLRVRMRNADYAGRHAVARLLASKSDDARSSDSIRLPAGGAASCFALCVPSASIWRQPASMHG
jgi:hypothetical protein